MSIEDQFNWLMKFNASIDFGNSWITITRVVIRQYEPVFKVIPMEINAGGFTLSKAIEDADMLIKAELFKLNRRYVPSN